jgi:hypothetical protein
VEQAKRPKRVMTVRVSEAGYELIRKRAERADVDVSLMVRRMLAYAAGNMPEDWVRTGGDR